MIGWCLKSVIFIESENSDDHRLRYSSIEAKCNLNPHGFKDKDSLTSFNRGLSAN